MKHLESLNVLIDKASAIAGSDYKLAQHLGVPRMTVSGWRHGRRTATPADQALMAHLAGLDPVQVLARATVEAYEGKPKGDALMKALGKASLAIGAALGSAGAVAQPIGSMIRTIGERAIQCIKGKQWMLCQPLLAP
jgi:hypothetical protein